MTPIPAKLSEGAGPPCLDNSLFIIASHLSPHWQVDWVPTGLRTENVCKRAVMCRLSIDDRDDYDSTII